MNIGLIAKNLGIILSIEAIAMIPSFAIACYNNGPDVRAFLLAIIITLIFGSLLMLAKPTKSVIRYREGFVIVGLGWILVSLAGALPFLFAHTFNSFIDCIFESISGFTTTGATVIKHIEEQPLGILFWRSVMHWLGGMGILVFTLALLPSVSFGTNQLFKTEAPGLPSEKIVPKIRQTAKLLYGVYLLLTIAQIIALKITGMSFFDAIINSFSTLGTGGFSNKDASIGYYNNPVYEYIIGIFMLLAGINFTLHYSALRGEFSRVSKDKELQFYLITIALATIFITFNINSSIINNLKDSFRQAFFQVTSIISTTGFSTADFDKWPDFSRLILLMLMFLGGCSASTGGGIKHIRIIVLLKVIRREFFKLYHPKAIIAIKVGDKVIPEETVQNTIGFVLLYLVVFILGSLILSTQNMDLLSSTSAVAATLGNVGPGFGLVGPSTNYAHLTSLAKGFLALFMIFGRLEIYTLLILFMPSFWKK